MHLRRVLIYGGAYLLLTVIGQLSLQPGNALPFLWPAAGVAAAWAVRARDRRELYIALGVIALITAAWFGIRGGNPAVALLLALGTSGIALLPRLAFVLHRRTGGPAAVDGPPALRRPVDFFVLLIGTFAGGVVSALFVVAAALAAGGRFTWSRALGFVLGNTVGAFTVAATVLAVLAARTSAPVAATRWARVHLVERGALFLAAIGLTLIVFAPGQTLSLTFLLLVVVVWAGMRLHPDAAAVLGLLLVITSIVLVRFFAGGPFAPLRPLSLQVIVLQAYAGVVFGLALMIALVATERRDLAARLIVSEQAAREDAARLRAVTDNTGEGIIVLDREGRHLLRNPVAERLIAAIDVREGEEQLAFGQMYGLDGRLLAWQEMPVVRAFGGETVRDFPVRHQAYGDSRIWAIDAVPIRRGPDGRPDQILVLVRDITGDQRRLEQLETFAATVAHDLQGPIAGVIGWAETGLDQLDADGPRLRTELRSTLGRIQRSSRRAQGLINDLLGYASARTAPVSPDEIDLDDLVDEVAGELLERHPDRAARITHGVLGRLQADPAMIRQVLGNLLGNALKYAHPDRSAQIHVAARRTDGELVLEIADNGIGIPADQRSRVFDAFHRVTGQTGGASSGVSGTGLGLAIVAQAVARHGGRITVGDRPRGPGSRFVVTLPDRQRTGTPTASVR